jgi:hypothetical protein
MWYEFSDSNFKYPPCNWWAMFNVVSTMDEKHEQGYQLPHLYEVFSLRFYNFELVRVPVVQFSD